MIERDDTTPSSEWAKHVPFKSAWLSLLGIIVVAVIVARVGNGLLVGVMCVGGILAIACGVIWYTVHTRRTL